MRRAFALIVLVLAACVPAEATRVVVDAGPHPMPRVDHPDGPAEPAVTDAAIDHELAVHAERVATRQHVSRVRAASVSQPSSPPPVPAPPPATGTPTAYQVDALGDCESGDHDGLEPFTYDPTTDTGNGYLGAHQWAQSSWNSHVEAMGRADLVGAHIPSLPYETQRHVTMAVPLDAWDTQFPGCYLILRAEGVV